MSILNIAALSVLLAFPFPTFNTLEQAFLQNSPETLRGLFSSSGDIPLSLPEPLACADQVSPDQAYFIFKQIFGVFKTTEFYIDQSFSSFPGKPGGIIGARWSFRNQRTGNRYPFRVFFFFAPEVGTARAPALGPRLGFKIVEIRAERL